jgi:hypothetical protein
MPGTDAGLRSRTLDRRNPGGWRDSRRIHNPQAMERNGEFLAVLGQPPERAGAEGGEATGVGGTPGTPVARFVGVPFHWLVLVLHGVRTDAAALDF